MNKLGDYPVWLFMFIGQIVLPMLGCAAVAIKILVKNGKDITLFENDSITDINYPELFSLFHIDT